MDNNENKNEKKYNKKTIKKLVYNYKRKVFNNKVRKLILKLIKK